MIAQATGKYLVRVKGNQKELLKQVVKASETQAFYYQTSESEKGHGRVERRIYEFYDLLEIEKAER